MKSLKMLFILGTIFTSSFIYADNLPQYSTIFTLERTLNTNQLVYEANILNQDDPIHPYWVMREQDGHFEELNRMERNRAYGVEIVKQSSTEVEFVIVSFRSLRISVRLNPVTKAPYATVTFSSGEKILKNIFLTVSGGLIPKVSKADISYQDTNDGPVMHEVFDPN